MNYDSSFIQLFNDLGFDYDRLSTSGQKTYDEMALHISRHAPQYLREHSDFDNGFIFEYVLECLKNEGFQDTSYRNDTSPSIGYSPDGQWASYVQIFVDYRDQEKSEHGDCDPSEYFLFTVQLMVNEEEVKSYRTNEAHEAIYYAWELRNELSPDKTVWVNRHRLDLPPRDDDYSNSGFAFVAEGDIVDTDLLDHNLHIEVMENGDLYLILERSEWVMPNTPENLDHLTRILLGWAICEGYYDGFPIVKDEKESDQ